MPDWFIKVLGGILVVTTLADLYLTVLYARSGIGVITHRLDGWTWRCFRRVAHWFSPSTAQTILTFCGPTLLILMAATWICGLLFGFALIIWPALGTGVRTPQYATTTTDYLTAVYFAGYCMTTVGNGDLHPETGFYRVLVVIMSVIGISVITLMLTYFVQIYNALLRRNVFALSVQQAAGGTSDAVEFLAGLGPGGDFSEARSRLAQLAGEITLVYESHHFYPALHYFHFRESYYAISHTSRVLMETATLVRTALDEQRMAAVVQSSQVRQLWEAGLHLLVELTRLFVPTDEQSRAPDSVSNEERALWRQRYFSAIARLRDAGIPTTADEQEGAQRYIDLRREWDSRVAALARYMVHAPAR